MVWKVLTNHNRQVIANHHLSSRSRRIPPVCHRENCASNSWRSPRLPRLLRRLAATRRKVIARIASPHMGHRENCASNSWRSHTTSISRLRDYTSSNLCFGMSRSLNILDMVPGFKSLPAQLGIVVLEPVNEFRQISWLPLA